MPADPKAQIERINQVSAMARTSWIALLGYLAFVGVTLLGVEDADFFVPTRQTRLPLVGVDIPTASFFIFAPILAAALYVYLHIILLKLWDAIGDLTETTSTASPSATPSSPGWSTTGPCRSAAAPSPPPARCAPSATSRASSWSGPPRRWRCSSSGGGRCRRTARCCRSSSPAAS